MWTLAEGKGRQRGVERVSVARGLRGRWRIRNDELDGGGVGRRGCSARRIASAGPGERR
jgi:hypothetical protein